MIEKRAYQPCLCGGTIMEVHSDPERPWECLKCGLLYNGHTALVRSREYVAEVDSGKKG